MEMDPNLRSRNEPQIALATKFYGFADDERTAAWVEKYSDAFRALAAARPDLLSRFPAEPDAVLAEAEQALYAAELRPARP